MDLFHVIDDAHAILRLKGVFRQVALFRRADEMFAKWGSGFIRLLPCGHTTQPNVSWIDLDPGKLAYIKTPSALKILDHINQSAEKQAPPLAEGA